MGRPKNGEAERYDCGKAKPAPHDFGTIEQRLKRDIASGRRTAAEAQTIISAIDKLHHGNIPLLAVGRAKIQKLILADGTISRSELKSVIDFSSAGRQYTGTEALDVLLGRSIIDRDQFDVALEFAACWCAYIGRPWPKGWNAERQDQAHDGGLSESYLRRMKIRYWNCLAAMDVEDRAIYPIVRDIAIDGKLEGIVDEVLRVDLIRLDGGLIARRAASVPPALRARIGLLTGGLEILAATPQAKDFSREASAILATLEKRDRAENPLTRS
jgi:hypothetical protein